MFFLIMLGQLAGAAVVLGQDVVSLARCVDKTFSVIGTTGTWSGKPPAGCPAKVVVEQRPGGMYVTTWRVEQADGGWVRTAFTGAMATVELGDKKRRTQAGKDMVKRAAHLERCLKSINAVNDPLDCRDYATKSYLVDEESGVETNRLVWLDDDGRHAVVEYTVGTTSATPSPPADLLSGQQLPPGTIINLRVRQ